MSRDVPLTAQEYAEGTWRFEQFLDESHGTFSSGTKERQAAAWNRFEAFLRLGFEKAVSEAKDTAEAAEGWEIWDKQKTTLKHVGETVEVRHRDGDEVLLTGRVVGYTDLLGSGGILQPDPEKGMNNVTAALRFPQDPEEFASVMSDYKFRVVA